MINLGPCAPSLIVVPKSMRPSIHRIQQVHSAHTGKARCLHKARAEFFWPRTTEDITEAGDTCEACQKFSRSQPEEEILSFPPTTEPMQLVGSDLFAFAGNQHVIMADAFSGMIFVKRLTRETSTAVINALMSFFRLIGLPQNLMSDNGDRPARMTNTPLDLPILLPSLLHQIYANPCTFLIASSVLLKGRHMEELLFDPVLPSFSDLANPSTDNVGQADLIEPEDNSDDLKASSSLSLENQPSCDLLSAPAVVGSNLIGTQAGNSSLIRVGPYSPHLPSWEPLTLSSLLPPGNWPNSDNLFKELDSRAPFPSSNDQQHPSTLILENTRLDHCYHSIQPLSKWSTWRRLRSSKAQQHRIDLKIGFSILKDKVPELQDIKGASKVVILNKAALYSKQLFKTNLILQAESDRLTKKNAELTQQLTLVKRAFTATHPQNFN